MTPFNTVVEDGSLDPLRISLLEAISHLEAIASHSLNSQTRRLDGYVETANETEIAQKIIDARARANEILQELSILHSPALDILLDLFVNGNCGRAVSVSEASIAGRCAPTTGLRWVKVLSEAGLVQKKDDLQDNRRAYISLTPQGREMTKKCVFALLPG